MLGKFSQHFLITIYKTILLLKFYWNVGNLFLTSNMKVCYWTYSFIWQSRWVHLWCLTFKSSTLISEWKVYFHSRLIFFNDNYVPSSFSSMITLFHIHFINRPYMRSNNQIYSYEMNGRLHFQHQLTQIF
jgi:hypothetical protein